MDPRTASPENYVPVHYRTLHALCEQLRQVAARVVPPVHLFDIPPQVMRGLFAVALVTGDGELHRCVLPYRDAGALVEDRQLLAKLLLWGDMNQTEGRIEIGANTGTLLRYFLPNVSGGSEPAQRQHERSHADWLAAADGVTGPRQLWRLRAEDGAVVGGISARGVHYLVRLQRYESQRLEAARSRLGCRVVGEIPAASPLGRDALGEWQQG